MYTGTLYSSESTQHAECDSQIFPTQIRPSQTSASEFLELDALAQAHRIPLLKPSIEDQPSMLFTDSDLAEKELDQKANIQSHEAR